MSALTVVENPINILGERGGDCNEINQQNKLPLNIQKYIYHEISQESIELLTNTFNNVMPLPHVIEDGANKIAIVWRGLRGDQLVQMAKYQSAGDPANAETTPPTELEVRRQVGEKEKLPEFTFQPSVAEGFGRRHFIVSCAIDTRYLAQGSKSEGGVVTRKDTPLKIIAWKEGPSYDPVVMYSRPDFHIRNVTQDRRVSDALRKKFQAVQKRTPHCD